MELFSLEIEQQVLGACLRNNNFIDRVTSFIAASDFYDPLHQRVFAEMQRMHGLGNNINPASMYASMKDDVGIVEVGATYFHTLDMAAPTLPNARDLGNWIKEFSNKRAILSVAEGLVENIGEGYAKEHIENAEKALYAIAEKSQFGSRMATFSDAIKLSMAAAEKAQKAEGKISGLATGLTEIDNMLGGLQPSDLIIIAGRPGMGKTALATNMGFHAAANGHPGLFFSLEMAAQQLSTRILCEQSGVEMWKVRNGQMRPAEWDSYVEAGGALDTLPLHIDDTGGITLAQLASRARRAKREHRIEWIVVDYLQLMDGTRPGSNQNRVQELTHITKGLKALAKELDVPIIALSQLSRGVDSRDDKRPVLSDLRESGSIEQDADIVMFVFREEYYARSREPDISDPLYGKWQEKMEKCAGKADVIVEKHRHGASGTCRVGFDGRFTKFSNLPED